MKQLAVNGANGITAVAGNQQTKIQPAFRQIGAQISRRWSSFIRPLKSETFKSEESGIQEATPKKKTSVGLGVSYAAVTATVLLALVNPFVLSSCGGTTINVVAPPPTQKIEWVDLSDINNGYYNRGTTIEVGKQFTIPLDTLTVPALGGNTTKVRNSDNKEVTIIQTNEMVITGIVTSQGGTLEGTISDAYTLAFKTAVDGKVIDGSDFVGGETQLHFLNESTIYISTTHDERDSGQIWGAVGNPIHGNVGSSPAFARAINYPPVDLFVTTVATEYHEETLFKDAFYTAIIDYGTRMDGFVHSVSPMGWIAKNFDTGVNFSVGSPEYDAGLYNMDVRVNGIGNGTANYNVSYNRYEMYPDSDNSLFTQYIGGNVGVSRSMGSGNRVRELTFSAYDIPVREDMPASVFSSTDKVQVWFRDNPNSSNPDDIQFIISSKK